MNKVELINSNELLVESQKAVKVALEKEAYLYGDLPKEYKLRMIKERKEETTSKEEYEAISNMEKQLELEIRFNQSIPLVPEEYKEIIQRNVEIEEAERKKKLREVKAELKAQLPYLKGTLLPLLANLNTLRALGIVPFNVKQILKGEYSEHRSYKVANIVRSIDKNYGRETLSELKSIIEKIEGLQ